MTLEGAKFICLDEAGNHGKIVLAKGRKFTMGYYVSCDLILVDERAKGVHCEIECDAFGRVTIRNLSPDKPILVNGSSVEMKRILLNNSKLLILDKEYLWQFSKGSTNEFQDLPIETASTPLKQNSLPEQPPNSCPDFKLHRDMPKRFTVHNFAYCIQSDEEGNTSSESNYGNTCSDTDENRVEIKSAREIETKDSNGKTPENIDFNTTKEVESRSITPEPNNELAKSTSAVWETPKMNIINCSIDKENKSTQKKMNELLKMCHQSDLVITSYSPRETGVKIEKSFAAIIKPKVLVTKPPLTPKSVYSTPKSDMNEVDDDDDYDKDLMTFHTPSTSKKGMGSISAAKILKNSSMHLIDLTTPGKLRPSSPYLKPAMKSSAKKNIQTSDKSRIKLLSHEQLGTSSLPATPVEIGENTNRDLETPSSVVNVSSSTDISSVIEISDGSDVSVTSASATGLNASLKAQTRTPKKTPHSLIKRALLTSAKKQNTMPQQSTQNSTTPHREFLSRKVMRGNLGLPGTPATPQASAGNLCNRNLLRRQSMSTPTRKNISARIRFDNAPSTSNTDLDSPSTSSRISRRSSLNPISAARYLSTSTPMSASRNNAALGTRGDCKTSPLHKVLKSSGGVTLSSHISKACRSIALPHSTSKITSIKEKSPQQVMSDRLVTRARNLLRVTPISDSSRKIAASVKLPSHSPVQSIIIQGLITQSAKKLGQKDSLLANKQSVDDSQENLSRTFTIDSDEEENVDNKKQQEIPKDATFSPRKNDLNETEVNSTKKPDNKETVKNQQPIEIPVDVEEVASTTKENKEYEGEDKNPKGVESKNLMEKKDNNSTINAVETIKATVTEESFAEVINDLHEQHEVVAAKENEKEDAIKTSDQEEANVVDTGFGEESFVQTANNENVHSEGNSANCSLNNESETQNSNATTTQCSQKSAMEAAISNTILKENEIETETLDAQAVEVEQKACEYKPIVEDITLEDSLIEKEAKENAQIIITKQHVTILEDSLIEGKVKDEKIKEEDTEIVLKECTDKEQLSTSTKVSEMCELIEKESCFVDNTDHERIMPQTKEAVDTYESKSLELKEVKESNKLNETIEKLSRSPQSGTSDKYNVLNVDAFHTSLGSTTTSKIEVEEKVEESKSAGTSKAYQFNADTVDKTGVERTESFYKESQYRTDDIDENRIDDIEDTNKLLEEIEDVLNKSDEIKQKHLNELEECSDKPLSEEFETEQLSEVEDAKESEKIGETSIHTNKPITQVVKNEEKKTEESIKTMDATCVKINFDGEEPKAQTHIPSEENSEGRYQEFKTISDCTVPPGQLKDNTKTDFKNTKLISQDNSETTNDDNSEGVEKEMLDLCSTKKSENKKTENEQNIENLENIVCESEIVDSCEERSTLITNDVQGDNSPNNENEINFEVKNDQNIAAKNTTSNLSEDRVTESELKDSGKNLQVEENISEIENTEGETIQKKLENEATFTPRRSTRRASQSTDTPEPFAGLAFTPRRSARRASVSVESPITCTPTRRTSRRSSLSIDNEGPLTPKPITKRRVSISIDNETYKPSTSKIQRAKTPRKHLDGSMIIPEEMDDEEQPARQKLQFDEKKCHSFILHDNATPKSSENLTPRSKTSRKQLELSLTIPEEVNEEVVVILSDEIKPENELNNTKDLQAEQQTELAEIAEIQSTSLANCPVRQADDENISKIEDTEIENNLTQEKNPEIPEKCLDVLISSAETTVAHNKNSEHGNETAASKDNSNTVDIDIVDFVKVQGCDYAVGKSETPDTNEFIETAVKQYERDKDLTKEVNPQIAEDNYTNVGNSSEYHKDKEISGSLNSTETSAGDNIKPITNELAENAGNEQQKEIATPEKCAKILEDNPNTPIMSGVRELLKTPKAAACTPRLGGIRDLVRTPKETLETEQEEFEKLAVIAELVRTPELHSPEISSSVCNKVVKNAADSSRTPSMVGMRELLKTPKPEPETPRLEGIRKMILATEESSENEDEIEQFVLASDVSDISSSKLIKCEAESPKTPLMKRARDLSRISMDTNNSPKFSSTVESPKSRLENDQEEIEKLSVLTAIVKTEEITKDNRICVKNDNLEGVKELLKTPKSCSTPRFKGIRELMQTPRVSSTPKMSGIKELLESPTRQEDDDLPTSTAEINATLIVKQNSEHLKSVKEMVKTPKSYRTPLLKGIKELMQTPKVCSTPLLAGVKELMDTPAAQEDNELEKFLRTPAAKNVMIPGMPASAVIEKSSDSIEVSTEYDLNATNEDEGTNLEELFKTPMTSRFVERITGSYYDEEIDEREQTDDRCDSTQNESLHDTINKSAEEAFDKLIGQDTQILTPISKRYARKSFTMHTPQCQSPFTAADVLSDLPKTDVEEWIETLDQAEPPAILDCDDIGQNQDLIDNDIINESLNQTEEASCSIKTRDEENMSFNESIIPETCTKVYLTEKDFKRKNKASLSYAETKDPLMNTAEKLNENETRSLLAPEDAEISGIHLLDQTFESLQDEPSMFDEHLVVEEASMFEEALIVSDNESEAENTITGADNADLSQDGGNGLSEPLLVSDSEDPDPNSILETESVLEVTQSKDDVLQTSNFEMDAQEKSIVEKASSEVHNMTEDPLETGVVTKDKTLIDTEDKEANKSDKESSFKTDDNSALTAGLLQDVFTPKNEEIKIVEQENFEIVEVLSTSDATEVLEIPSTSSSDNKLTIENDVGEINVAETVLKPKIDAKEIAIEQTKVISVESEDIFVDSSVTEICEETGVLNEQQVDREEDLLSLKNNQVTSDECQDIFMDNSNIDETFADEAFAKESVQVTSTDIENNSQAACLSVEADNNEIVDAVSDTAHSNEMFAVTEAEIPQTQINANADNNKSSEKTTAAGGHSSLTSQELNRSPENMYDLPELLLQGETQRTENNVIEVESPEQNALQTEPVEMSETKTENLIEKQHVEADPSEILVTETKPVAEELIETQTNKTVELHGDSPLASNSAQSLVESTKSNETILDCKLSQEVNSNSAQDETFKEIEHEAVKELIPSSTKLISSDSTTDAAVPQPIKHAEQSSLQPKHDNSPRGVEIKINVASDINEIMEHVAEKQTEEPFKDIENISNDKFISKNESLQCKASPSSSKVTNIETSEENVQSINKTEKDDCESAKDSVGVSEYDIILEESENISSVKKVSSIFNEQVQKDEVKEDVLPKELDKVEVIIEKSLSSPTTTQAALSKSNSKETESSEDSAKAIISSSEVIKYDFEIEIINVDHRKETETDRKEDAAVDDDTTSVTDKITYHLEEESDALQEDKVENVENNSAVEEEEVHEPKHVQQVAEVSAEANEIKVSKISNPKAVRGKRTVSESSQESTQGDETSISTRRNRRKIIKRPLPEKLEEVDEDIKDNKQNVETAEVFTQEHEVLAKETPTEEIVETTESQKQTAATSKQKPGLSEEKLIPSDAVDKSIKEKILTKVITTSEESTLADPKEQNQFSVAKEIKEDGNIENPDVQLPQGSPLAISITQDAMEKQVFEKLSNDQSKLSNVIQVSQQEKDPEAVKGNLAISADVIISPEETKHQIAKRTRRKPGGCESNQESVLQDAKKSGKASRRKMQKVPAEEVAVDRSKDEGKILENVIPLETAEVNLESAKVSIETEHGVEQIACRDDKIVDTESGVMEAEQRTEKRIRRNATVAEAAPNSVNKDDTSRTRRGRRKLLKTPVEEVVIEKETCEDKTEENKQDVSENANDPKEKKQALAEDGHDVGKNVKEIEEPSNDDTENKINCDVSQVEPNETLSDAKHDPATKPGQNNTHLQMTEDNKIPEISKDAARDETTTRRGRNKRALQESVLEEPTTSRKGRRKAQILKTETPEDKMESAIKTQLEDVIAIEAPIVVAATGEPQAKEANEFSPEEMSKQEEDGGDLTPKNSESSTSLWNQSVKHNHQTADEEPNPAHELSIQVLSAPEMATEKEMHQVEHFAKRSSKRGRPPKNQASNETTTQMGESDVELNITSAPKNENIPSSDERLEVQKDIAENPQKSSRRRAAVNRAQDNKHQEELIIKSRKRRAGHDESEIMVEPKKLTEDSSLSEVKITEANLEPEMSIDQPTLPQEVKLRKGRKKPIYQDHDESGPSSKTRVGRKKPVQEKHETAEDIINEAEKVQKDNTETPIVNEEARIESNTDKPDAEKESKQMEISEIPSRSRRNIGRRKPDYKEDNDKQLPHDPANTEDVKEDIVSGESKKPQEPTKKGRERKRKNDAKKEADLPTPTHSPDAKLEDRDIHDDQISKEAIQNDDSKLIKEPETNINIPTANTQIETPHRSAPVARKGRKAFVHITAESQEPDDTPGRRARNVPQRRAATAYHNYNETSDTEVSTKTKKKTDSPRKSLEGSKKSPTVTITAAPFTVSPSPASSASITTARGRTRKPTAKVQQFLEEERAKAETPKKRALLAAAAAAAMVDAGTPQVTPARRGRKPSTIEIDGTTTPQASKSRGRGRPPVHTKEEGPTSSALPEIITVVEEKEIALEKDAQPVLNTVKERKGGRKAKITDEHLENSDEPPAKKSDLELISEKQVSTSSAETTTSTPPTRVAGRRNAAAAAKARIEEDALAAAAIDPPKRARAKKVTPKVSTPVVAITGTDAHNSEVEEEHPAKLEKDVVKDKSSSQKREHRLASASTVEDLQNDNEMETEDKPTNKRGHKALASTTTDSPAVPAKRGRKPKVVEGLTNPETPGDTKTTRGRGRGRKNVHFDEHKSEATSSSQENVTDVEPTSVDAPAPVKKGTRTRRK